QLQQGTTGGGVEIARRNADGLFYINHNLFQSVLNAAFVIQTDGKVGIGLTNPSYTLSVAGTIWANGANISAGVATWSDQRWKKNIKPLGSSLTKVEKLQGVTYDWETTKYPGRNFPKGKQIGLIAQEVEKIYPEFISEDKDGYKLLSYDKISAVLIEAVKELSAKNAALEAKMKEMEKKIK
ncbi:MAG: tail fiber domain-containing protein, partial [Candidatus Margulisiibacteriota bacterium]